MALRELNTLKSNFTSKLKTVEDEKQRMILERDELKEKLLRYELVLSEIRTNNTKGVESILKDHVSLQMSSASSRDLPMDEDVVMVSGSSPEHYPGNSKGVKSSSSSEVGSMQHRKTNPVPTITASEENMSKVTDLFFQQQEHFLAQQDVLQTQIEQLQKLQDGILLQQEHHLKEKLQQNQNVQQPAPPLVFSSPPKLKHSQKLQNYITEQSSSSKPNMSTSANNANNPTSSALVEDVMLDEGDKEAIVTVQCLNPRNITSSVNTGVQTDDVTQHMHEESYPAERVVGSAITKKDNVVKEGSNGVDMCVGTDNMQTSTKDVDTSPRKYGFETLELCKGHVKKLGDVLSNISSDRKPDNKSADQSALCPPIPKDVSNRLDGSVQQGEIPIEDFDGDINAEENTSSTSALQQMHFRPTSMLELIEGIQPSIASTSIHSISKRNRSPPASICKKNTNAPTTTNTKRDKDGVRPRTPLSPTNTSLGGKVVKPKHEQRGSKPLQKVSGATRSGATRSGRGGAGGGRGDGKHSKVKTLEDIEEQKMIADVFFVR